MSDWVEKTDMPHSADSQDGQEFPPNQDERNLFPSTGDLAQDLKILTEMLNNHVQELRRTDLLDHDFARYDIFYQAEVSLGNYENPELEEIAQQISKLITSQRWLIKSLRARAHLSDQQQSR